jgi:excisionase family DNA binding protein
MSRLDPTTSSPPEPTERRRQLTLLTIREAATWFGVSETQIRRWLIEGSMQRVRTPAGSRIPVTECPGFEE